MGKNYRAPWHDYMSKCSYHITLMKSPQMPPFGHLAGDFHLPIGAPGSSYIKASPLGKAVKAALREISVIHPALRVYQYALMPDHLHILLGVESELDEILGRKIAIFKSSVNQLASSAGVFASGFHDVILNPSREFDTIINYLRSNPHRLAVRQALPDFFHRQSELSVGEVVCSAYGNLQLLENPFKEQVMVHRADTETAKVQNLERWIYTAANGGVIASPFISPAEKAVRKEIEEAGGRIILITNRRMGEREKPSAHDFELCEQGRLLILSPHGLDKALTRAVCLRMNAFAGYITKLR